MNMRRLTFVRHAESVANAGGRTMPHAEIPLSELGHHQADELAALLDVEPSSVLVSRFVRTQQTAAPFCGRHGIRHQIHPSLHEFSVIDPALIEGLDGAQRKPFVKTYWDDPDPYRRLGENADTFAEFQGRIDAFMADMESLPASTVIFGHGIWFALLFWSLSGQRVTDAESMSAFRRYQLAFPMPNCATFDLVQIDGQAWSVQARTDLAKVLASLTEPKHL